MSAPASSVEDWLRSLGLITYTEAFIENGYDELDICKEIGDEDLDAIGVVNSKDRADILNSVAKLKHSGTAVYFVLEGQGNYLPPQVQPRERYDKLKLKMMLHEKLEAQKISLTDSPYTNPDGTQGSLETLAKFLADSLYTFEEDVANALDSLWERQSATASIADNTPEPLPRKDACNIPSKRPSKIRPAPSPPGIAPKRPSSRPPSIPKNAVPLVEQDKTSEGSSPPDSPRADDMRKSIEYLDVENPQKKKKEKRRRPVERNSKLSRSMDSLPMNHVNNTQVKSRERESSSLKSKKEAKEVKSGLSFRLFRQKPKKSPSHSPAGTDATQEHTHVNLGRRGSAEMNASEITMGEEDRMALMICVKQGDLTVEEAVEQLQKFEDERRQRLMEQNKAQCKVSVQHKDKRRCFKTCFPRQGNDSEDERQTSKQKAKRGIFRSTKRKSQSRPNSSDVVACEITMSEENRMQLMRDVRDGKIDVEHAVTRLVSYEEQHGHGYIDKDGKASCFQSKSAKQIPRSPKTSLQRTPKGSIKRISGAISAAINTPNPDEPNAIFYTETTESEGVAPPQVIHEVASDSSAEPSPKEPHKPPRRKPKASPVHTLHSSSSSVDSTDKIEVTPAQREVHTLDHGRVAAKNPVILGEIREMLLKTRKNPEEDTRSETSSIGTKAESSSEVLETLKTVPLCNKHNKTPPPQPRKGSLPVAEPQRPAFEPFGSLPRLPLSQATTNTQRPTIPPRRPERSPPVRPDENPAPQRRPQKIPDRTPSVSEEEQTTGKLQISPTFPVPPPRSAAKKSVSEGITSSDAGLQEQQSPIKAFPDHRKSSSSQSSKDEEAGTDSEGHEPLVVKKPVPPRSLPEKVLTENDKCDPKRSPKQAPIKPKRKPPPLPSRVSQDSMSSVSSQDSVTTTGSDVQPQPLVSEMPTVPGRPDSSNASTTERPNFVASGKRKGEVSKRGPPVPVGGDTGPDTCSKPKPAPKPVLKPKPKIPAKKPMPTPGLSRIPVWKTGGKNANNQSNQHHGSSSSVNSNELIDGHLVSASSSPGGLESSISVENVTIETHNNATNHDRNTLPSRTRHSIKAPVAPKRPSHSLSDLIERRLRIEQINLAQPPYSDSDGRWHVPSNLVNRYSEELRRSSAEVASTMDRLRIVKLRNVHRHGEPCDVDKLDLSADELGNLSSVSEWLISLGLPMYIENLREVEYDDMNLMPNMEERHFNYAGVVDPRHMRRLLTSVALMPRDES